MCQDIVDLPFSPSPPCSGLALVVLGRVEDELSDR
jgi:ABC-type sulfate transport system permease subunit